MISLIRLNGHYETKQRAREELAASETSEGVLHAGVLEAFRRHRFRDLFRAMLHRDLTMDEAFAGMCYVLCATNGYFRDFVLRRCGEIVATEIPDGDFRIAGREFLSCMAMKEAKGEITAAEIAGMVAAAMWDLVARPDFGESILETSGMGGDIGFPPRDRPRKTINLSTLTALTLGVMGVPTMKHGSYANTSAVGSSDAMERLGARIEQRSVREMLELFQRHGFIFTDAHVVKTIHDLSHLEPRHETVNHIVGPMTPPIGTGTTMHKILGVNEKVHPLTIAKAFSILHGGGNQRIGNVAVVTGLDRVVDPATTMGHRALRPFVILDELSPFSSVVAFVRNGVTLGCSILTPRSFGLSFDPEAVMLENTLETISKANDDVIAGVASDALTAYLAMSAGLALYIARDMGRDPNLNETHADPSIELLTACADECRRVIRSGEVKTFLAAYVASTRHGIDVRC